MDAINEFVKKELKKIFLAFKCPCEIGMYIQAFFYDLEGDDAQCTFCKDG